jgi:WhiB family transcriptional regulator, redox-sensing transcriptional regulator
MAPMHRPGTTVVLSDTAGFETVSEQAVTIAGMTAAIAGTVASVPAAITEVPGGPTLPCTDDPDLFFAESPDDVESAKGLCHGCPARMACLTGALQRREPWGVWGGELFLRGEVVPRKRPRGRPRKDEVAA